jgi:hypothetical protein
MTISNYAMNIELKKCDEKRSFKLINMKDIQDTSLLRLNSTLYLLLYFFLYFACSIFLYEWLEGWDAITCIYFSIITFSTVGYGDYHPTDSISRIFTAFYIIFGVIIGTNLYMYLFIYPPYIEITVICHINVIYHSLYIYIPDLVISYSDNVNINLFFTKCLHNVKHESTN